MAHELGFAYIKSEGIGGECEEEVYDELAKNDLEIVYIKDLFVSYLKLRQHQPILFDIKGDLNDIWKIQGAARLIGSTVRSMLILGDDSIDKTFAIKQDIRKRYVLPCEFDRENEMSYPNFMHAADNRAQVENDVRVLIPDKLEYLRAVNGINEIDEQVW
jgi:hypothetical protein